MNEDEAYRIAVGHAKSVGARFWKCFHKEALHNVEMKLDIFADRPPIPGIRSKVWRFGFIIDEPRPSEVITKNAFFIDVDDESGICGYRI